MSPDGLTETWLRAIGDRPVRVLLADGDDPRTAEAARRLSATTPIIPVLGDRCFVEETAERLAPVLHDRLGRYPRTVRDALARDPLYLGVAAVRAGLADACVGGSTRPTADVIRAGLRVLGPAPSVRTVSSCFLMRLRDGRVIAYADCAVVPEPDAEQLAEIAIATGRTLCDLTGQYPIVAMLSFSTKGSADHPGAHRVRNAVERVRERIPELEIDGELQFDAAYLAEVGARKAAGSPVAGRANVFVFPDLGAGNIAYKITERLAEATAIGPLLQGLGGPLNDLSRGASAAGIATVALVTAVQAVRHKAVAGEDRHVQAG